MSLGNLLETKTVSYLELIGNGKTYVVPPYQRDYSWTEEQWDDLWQDVVALRDDATARHYMGAVVVKPETDRRFVVIDGQQRMATLSILALAVIGRLLELAEEGIEAESNRDRARELRARFVGEKDPASLLEVGKLELNERDNGFYQDYLVQLRTPTNPAALPRSNRLLWECGRFFENALASFESGLADGKRLASLLSETVARQLLFILITVEDEINAYTVFETLNARGLELTTTDLLKNYLFSRLPSPSDRAAVQRRWSELVTTVRQERFAEFLRYVYLTRYRKIRSGTLFKLVREEIRDSRAVLGLLDELERRAAFFDALQDSDHSFWANLPDAKPWVRCLRLFRVRQATPLLFAAYERFAGADLAKVLKLTVMLSFRYTVVAGLNPNELESAYHDAAASVLAGTSPTPRDVFGALRSIYVPDEKFRSDFTQLAVATSGQRRRLAKYILASLETDAGNRTDPDTDPGTIEHILPENPAADWESSVSPDRWEEARNRIGNLTLLEAPLNRLVGNASYPEKIASYEKSKYALTSRLAQEAPSEWTLAHIAERQSRLAERAVHIWRADYA